MSRNQEERRKRKNDDPNDPQAESQGPVQTLRAIEDTAGKVKRIFVRNFMCHEALEINLNPNVNFIIGQNGSGKSALLTALTVGLGARAGVTNRGRAVKEFIKTGKTSAVVEVTLLNEGSMSYKPEEYGSEITVVRNIGQTTAYKIKNWQGKVISTKKDELDQIVHTMNIQVDNPISVLNQDVAREFLMATEPSQKYELFMKATQLDVIRESYQTSETTCEMTRNRLEKLKDYLISSKRSLKNIQKQLKMLDNADVIKEEFRSLQLDLHWANAIIEEKKLAVIEETLNTHKEALTMLEGAEEERKLKDVEIATKIESSQKDIEAKKLELEEIKNDSKESRDRYETVRDNLSMKTREWKTFGMTVKRTEEDIATVCQEIDRLENVDKGKKTRLQQEQSKLTQDLEEVEAMLRTKQTDQMHLQADKERLEQELKSAKNDIQQAESRAQKSKQLLVSLKQQSDSSMTVFGPNVPRLLKRIEEESRRGRFHKKPIGPLGAYIEIKDASWTAAVESFLGAGLLRAFTVDNAQDGKLLRALINEIYGGQSMPIIITSKFFSQVHDVNKYSTYSENYRNLFDVMLISDPVVANCIIDQKEPECVMLIPTGREAADLLSDRRAVPNNCKIGITKQGDQFYPDPNYKSYAGDIHRPRFLQVSTAETIQAEEEKLACAREEACEVSKRRKTIEEKLQVTLKELGHVTQQVMKLRNVQSTTKLRIKAIVDDLAADDVDDTSVFKTEKETLEKKLVEQKLKEQELANEVEKIKNAVKEVQEEVNRYRDKQNRITEKINKIKAEIREFENEREMLRLNTKYEVNKITETRQVLQKSMAEYEMQKRVTDKALNEAESQCPRREITRTVQQIKDASNELRAKIIAAEEQCGSRDELEKKLAEKTKSYTDIVEQVNLYDQTVEQQVNRLKERRETFDAIKRTMSQKIQAAYVSILALRQYKGRIKISHSSKTLILEMSPRNMESEMANSTRTLSGGERSYSTVAFILSLWDCTNLPFYFLDEFDVFMDKVNRQIILDILLDHTRSHPQSQFVFLTPLDTSIGRIDNFLTIHKLAPPERGNHRD